MNMRLVQFSLGLGKRDVGEKIAERVIPAIRSQNGCVRAEFFADNETGDYGIVVFWASRREADAAASVIGPVLMSAVKEAGGEPNMHLFDVYDPQAEKGRLCEYHKTTPCNSPGEPVDFPDGVHYVCDQGIKEWNETHANKIFRKGFLTSSGS